MKLDLGVDIFSWDEQGYKPLVFFNDWQTAILNWEPLFDSQNLGEIERHNKSDEVFVLIEGNAMLFSITPHGEICVNDMVRGVIYNVKQGVWHNLLSTKSAKWIIVENRNTDITDTHLRQLTESEKSEIIKSFPAWISDSNLE
jgi:hypothetical protein